MAWSKNEFFKIFNYYIFLRIVKTPKNPYRTIPIKEIYRSIGSGYGNNYDWDNLEKDITKNGLKNRIHVYVIEKNDESYHEYKKEGYKYKILDGEHRACVMKKIFGENYKIKSRIFHFVCKDLIV